MKPWPNQALPTPTSIVLQIGLWGLVVLLGVRSLLFTIDVTRQPTHGFAAYYTAARLVADGANASQFYDNDWFQVQITHYGPAVKDIYNVNPPTMALLLLPLAGLGYTDARWTWALFNLACLAVAVGWLLRALNLRGYMAPAFLAFVLLYQPVYANISQGQAYVLLLLLLVVVWHGYRQHCDRMAGAALGVMLSLKTAGLLLWPLLLLQRRWRAVVWSLITVSAISLGSLPWLGRAAWRAYFALLPGLSARPEMAVTAYQTQLSLWRHLLTFDARWNPAPLFQAPALGMWLPWVGAAMIAGFSAYRALVTDATDRIFAAFVIANVLLSPVSLDYHYTLLLLPIAILVRWVQGRTSPWPAIALGLAMLLTAIDLPYWSPRLAAGIWALLAYPKLYAAALLWGLALWGGNQSQVPALPDQTDA